MRKIFLIGLTFLFCLSHSFSQQSLIYNHSSAEFDRAMELFKNGQYLPAQILFEQIEKSEVNESIKADCAYYIANAAIRLNQQNADQLIEDFVKEYPNSLKRDVAFLEVAEYYFNNGNYVLAQKWYDRANISNLNHKELEKYYFNYGYTHFQNKRFDEAKKFFNRITTSREYGSQAKYYLGYMAYEGDDYEEASELFDDVKGDERFSKELSYYEADMNFKLGNFEKAISTGKSEYNRSSPQEKNQLTKIIGESYFNLQLYDEAIPYLQEYRGTKGKWNNTDYYQLGYAYYQQGNYEKAIGEFNKIIGGTNEVAQNAYYHLAESYLKLEQKQQALNAFKNASEMDFNSEIEEDAFLNYAKLSYEIGNSYKSTPQILIEFIEKYPGNSAVSQVKELLIDSYISSRNYKEAMELLESNKNFRDGAAYQKVAFYRGMEMLNESDFENALNTFNKSLKEKHDAGFSARSTFWKAETLYELARYREAETNYEEFKQMRGASETPEFKNVNYHLGYTLFKQKNYLAAIEKLETFVKNTSDKVLVKDAYLRLGDSHFASRQYWPAMENYNVVLERDENNEYAFFQKAVSYGYVDRNERKIEELLKFESKFKNSVYRGDVLYELGNTYISENENQKAISAFEKLTQEIPNSKFVPQAMMKSALLYDNIGNSKKALSVFKQVAKDYPSSPEAFQAVEAAKNIYIDEGKVNDYAAWVKTLDFVELGDAELDDSNYRAAEQPYMENNFNLAKKRFDAYLKEFPNGKNALNAHFYLGQIYFSNKEFAKAIPHFEFVVNRDRNVFTEQALSRISESFLNEKDNSNAQRYLLRLEKDASSPQNIIFAQTNIMKISFELEQYEQAMKYAEKVLEIDQIDVKIRSDAYVYIARSAIETGNNSKAKNAYGEVQKIATGRLAAEALYYDAYFKNKENDFEESNKSVQQLAKDYSSYKKFGAQGLVLMAKNFYALNDAFQATYILENVINNFGDYPEIVEEAKAELVKIKKEEAKTNTSVEIED